MARDTSRRKPVQPPAGVDALAEFLRSRPVPQPHTVEVAPGCTAGDAIQAAAWRAGYDPAGPPDAFAGLDDASARRLALLMLSEALMRVITTHPVFGAAGAQDVERLGDWLAELLDRAAWSDDPEAAVGLLRAFQSHHAGKVRRELGDETREQVAQAWRRLDAQGVPERARPARIAAALQLATSRVYVVLEDLGLRTRRPRASGR